MPSNKRRKASDVKTSPPEEGRGQPVREQTPDDGRGRTVRARIEVSSNRGVFMISVAAELADMHPQTLRMYEQRGLIQPQRSPRGTRLYSQDDVERLRRIQEMTAELGLNLAGVERVLELEERLEHLERRYAAVERRRLELEHEVQRLRDEQRTAIVRYIPPQA